jgi:hypothetical protein
VPRREYCSRSHCAWRCQVATSISVQSGLVQEAFWLSGMDWLALSVWSLPFHSPVSNCRPRPIPRVRFSTNSSPEIMALFEAFEGYLWLWVSLKSKPASYDAPIALKVVSKFLAGCSSWTKSILRSLTLAPTKTGVTRLCAPLAATLRAIGTVCFKQRIYGS